MNPIFSPKNLHGKQVVHGFPEVVVPQQKSSQTPKFTLGGPQDTTCIEFQNDIMVQITPRIARNGVRIIPIIVANRPMIRIKNAYSPPKNLNRNVIR